MYNVHKICIIYDIRYSMCTRVYSIQYTGSICITGEVIECSEILCSPRFLGYTTDFEVSKLPSPHHHRTLHNTLTIQCIPCISIHDTWYNTHANARVLYITVPLPLKNLIYS